MSSTASGSSIPAALALNSEQESQHMETKLADFIADTPAGQEAEAILRRLRPTQLRELILILIILGLIVFFTTQVDNYLTGRTFNRKGPHEHVQRWRCADPRLG